MTDLAERVQSARTLLFVPGNRAERFDKAEAAGADLVVVDLEDAVPPDAKARARASALAWVTDHPCVVRINAATTAWFADDVSALAGERCAIMLPKAEDPRALESLAAALGPDVPVIALVETARGALQAPVIAAASGVARLAFGSFDLAGELGVSPDSPDAMSWTRGALVLASAAAGLPPPVDGVTATVRDLDKVRSDAQRGARLGFEGKLCIHPAQVAVVHDVLTPTGDDVSWASKVVDAVGNAGVAVVDGQMVDKPVVERARRVLRRFETSRPRDTQ